MRALRLALATALTTAWAAAAVAAEPRHYPSAQAAVDAMVAAVRGDDRPALLAILGSDAEAILSSGDPVQDSSIRSRFLAMYDQGHKLDRIANRTVLELGDSDWPFPIPLASDAKGWRFDTAAGKREILLRRVGGNELATIEAMQAYVDAQEDYGELQRAGGGPAYYAQRILSTPGTRDGLYWPTQAGEPPSPLGPLVADARAEGYRAPTDSAPGRTPYHGYLYRILTSQGPHAAGGAIDYVVDGKMLGGFALIATPARYGESGVMTFIVSHHGIVYQKNLGPQTATLAATITRFDPDPSWQPVDVP
jgi:hypothetical protein